MKKSSNVHIRVLLPDPAGSRMFHFHPILGFTLLDQMWTRFYGILLVLKEKFNERFD
jgi:hypothetical protein